MDHDIGLGFLEEREEGGERGDVAGVVGHFVVKVARCVEVNYSECGGCGTLE